MPLKRIAKYSLITVICTVCVLIAAYCYFFYVYMPNHFQKEILPALMKNAGISGFSGKVKSAGAFGANLGELCIGDPENPTLKVRSVLIKYRFHNIFMPRRPDITSMEFNGLELICRLRGKDFEVNNIDVEKFINQLKKHFSGRHKNAIGSWGNTKLKITNGLMRLDWNGTRLLLPFELQFNPGKQNWEVFTADLKYTWREHPINAKLTVDMEKQAVEINFKANTEMKKLLDLIEKSKRFDIPAGLRLAGLLEVAGKASFGFSPWKIQQVKLSGTSKNCYMNYGELSLCNKRRPSGLKIPMVLSVDSTTDGYIWKLENAMLKKPLSVFVRDVSCHVPGDKRKALDFDGEFEFELGKLKLLRYYNIKDLSKSSLVRKLSGRYNRITQNWQIQTPEQGDYARYEPVKTVLACGQSKIFAELGDLGINGRGRERSGLLELDMLIREFSATGYQNACFANKIKLNSRLRLIPASQGKVRIKKNSFKFTVPEVSVSSLARQMEIKDFTIVGSNSFDGFKMNGLALVANTETVHIKQNGEAFVGENNKFTLDGVMHKTKKTWEIAFTSSSENISGAYRGCDFNLRNARSKNFLTLSTPDFAWRLKGLESGNLRLRCDDASFDKDENHLRFSGLNLGTALSFSPDGILIKKTYSGKVAKAELKYKSYSASATRLELMGKYDPESNKKVSSKVKGKKEIQDFLTRLEAEALTLQCDDIICSAKQPQFDFSGKTGDNFQKNLVPDSVRGGLETSELSLMRGKELLKAVDLTLVADALLENSNTGIGNLKKAFNSLKLKIKSDKVSGIWDNINICSSKNKFDIVGEIKPGSDDFEIKKFTAALSAEKTMVYGKSWKLASSRLKSNASGAGKLDSKFKFEPEMRCYGFYASSHDAAFNAPEASVKTQLNNGKFTGSLFYDKGAFYKNNLKLACTGISMFLPFGVGASEGTMEVKQVKLDKRKLGQIDAKLQYKSESEEIAVRASHFSKVFPNASLFFRGRLKLDSFPDWEGDFTVPEFKLQNPLSAGEMFPVLKNIGLSGKTSLEGSLKGNLKDCSASGTVSLNGGSLYFDAWELSGVKGKCTFTDLLKLKSNARQKLYCRQLRNDSIELYDMFLEFEPHGLEELQIDRLVVKWFGGTLTSLSSFILKNNNSVPEKVNFLASGITLSPFLEYLGVKGFVTDAVVGGVMPFSIKSSKVYIPGAALATKASDMGFLRLEGNLDNYAYKGDLKSKAAVNQRDFAVAALRRFNYNWIHLNARTDKKKAEVALSIDGYPSKALPFRYDEQKKMFIPVSSEEPGINGDMTIETNFKIPVDKK